MPPRAISVPTLVLAGTGVETCVGVRLSYDEREQPVFSFVDTTMDGDGTVAVASADALPGAICRLETEGRHADLPLYPTVRRVVLGLLHGDDPNALPSSIDRGFMDGSVESVAGQVPETPVPGTLSDAEVDQAAARITAGNPTPEDLAILTRGW
jgi:hypothetical protein